MIRNFDDFCLWTYTIVDDIWQGLAWDLARDRLYIAAADRDHVVVVDLAQGTILRQADLPPRASALDRLVSWLMPTAAAKGEPATRRQAMLSPDGQRLYLVGVREGADWSSTGVDVVDANELNLLTHLDLPASSLELLPGGQRLLVHLFWPAHADVPARQAISIRDPERLTDLGQVTVDNASQFGGCSRDGSLVYTVQTTNGRWEQQLQVVNVATQQVVAVRPFDQGTQNNYFQLIPTRQYADAFCPWD